MYYLNFLKWVVQMWMFPIVCIMHDSCENINEEIHQQMFRTVDANILKQISRLCQSSGRKSEILCTEKITVNFSITVQ